MPFKIIQTKENDKIVLTIVPSQWEQSGTLFWPCHRNEVKLIHDAESVPKTDWKRIQCIKKRDYLTLHEAERELEIMEQASDTDAETSNKSTSKQKSRQLHNTRVLQPIDLNDQLILAQNKVANVQSSVTNVQASSSENYGQVENNIEPMVITIRSAEQVLPSNSRHDIENNNSPVVTFLNNFDTNTSDSNSSNIRGSILDPYVNVTQNDVLAQLLQNQEKILSHLASLQASVDFLMGANIRLKPTEQSLNRLPVQPLNSKNDFDELESKLKDEIFYNKVVTELTFICGNSGKCKGVDSCYKLIDYFFTRHIFLHCNWTGSTRDSNAEKKIPFKYYFRIRNCFFDIIRKSDLTFTENDADKFFKVIIKNAKPRLLNKVNSVARASKLRVKKQVIDGRNIEQLQGNGESSPSQQVSNEEAMNVPLQNDESAADNLNGEENEREVVQNNERDENA